MFFVERIFKREFTTAGRRGSGRTSFRDTDSIEALRKALRIVNTIYNIVLAFRAAKRDRKISKVLTIRHTIIIFGIIIRDYCLCCKIYTFPQEIGYFMVESDCGDRNYTIFPWSSFRFTTLRNHNIAKSHVSTKNFQALRIMSFLCIT